MDFKVEPLGPCRKKVAVTIPAERVGEEYDKKYDEINEKVPLPGFRPGHAPRRLLEKRFATRLADEVKGDLVKAALEELFEDKSVQPLAPPEIEVDDLEVAPGQPLAFDFELVTKPEFETPTYKGLELKVPPVRVSDEEVDEAVDRLRRRSANLQTAEGAQVEEGDVLVVDWKAREGDSVEAHDENAYYPYGRGVLAGFVAPAIDEQLAGAKADARAQAEVEVAADDPREELRGRALQLEVHLKEVKRYVLPPVDEAFLKKHDFDDEAELREDTRKKLSRAKVRRRDAEAGRRLVEGLLDGVEISLPEDFVEKELAHWAVRKRVSLQMEQVEDEEISKRIEAARADTRSAIERDMQRHFLLERIAEEEGVTVGDADLMQAIQEIAMVYGHPVEQVAASFRDASRLAELQAEIRDRKAQTLVREAASLVEDEALEDWAPEAGAGPAAKEAPPRKAGAKKAAAKKAPAKKAPAKKAPAKKAAAKKAPAKKGARKASGTSAAPSADEPASP
jgi:trigger factor